MRQETRALIEAMQWMMKDVPMSDGWVLSTSGLDEEDAVHEFPDRDTAIAYALHWFLSGYFDNETIPDPERLELYRYAKNLMSDLEAGREFYCPMFYERASLAPSKPAQA